MEIYGNPFKIVKAFVEAVWLVLLQIDLKYKNWAGFSAVQTCFLAHPVQAGVDSSLPMIMDWNLAFFSSVVK